MPDLKRTEQLMFDQLLKDLDAYYDAPENRHLLKPYERNYKEARDVLMKVMPAIEAEQTAARWTEDFFKSTAKQMRFRVKYYNQPEVEITFRRE